MVLKAPGFTFLAVITLAVGIAANTTIFSLIDALILRPPAFVNPDQVVSIWKTPVDRRDEGFISYLDFRDWRTRARTFEDIAAYKSTGFNLATNGEVERIQGMRVTAGFLPLLKTALLRGRNFQPEEEKTSSQPVAIISYKFWQTRLGGRDDVLSQQINLNNKPYQIIGVLPQRFQFPLATEEALVWTTVAAEARNLDARGAQIFAAVGRLRAGITPQQAESEIATIASDLAQEYPASNRNSTAFVVSAHEQIVGKKVRRALWLLFGAVAFILLIACTNTANLLLVRAAGRQKEIALRAALGAGRWHIVRQLLAESFILSALAGVVGLLLAFWGLAAIRVYAADQLPRISEAQIDSWVLLFTVVVSMLTGLFFGLIPALDVSRADVNEVLKAGSKSVTGGKSARVWRDSLVILEVALSLILLVGAGLMIKSFRQLVNVQPGFDPSNVLTGRISLSGTVYGQPEQRAAYVDQTLERLRSMPGVESAAFVAPMPFSGADVDSDFRIEGKPQPEPGLEPTANNRSVTPDYFRTMKIPLLAGRHFNEQDKRSGTGAAIVNQAFVLRYLPNEDPIGKRISGIGANQNDGDPETWEIVGVVGDVHHSSLKTPATPEIYLPFKQNSWSWGNFLVRTVVPPVTVADRFRDEVRAVDKSVPLTALRPLTVAISETVTDSRLYTLLFGTFGVVGLLLTMTGVYGLISNIVAQRTREIGIRVALGATRHNVIGLVMRQGIVLALIGTAIGVAVSLAVTRAINSLLFEVRTTDPLSFGIAVVLLLGSAIMACYLPALRATRVDPLVALRYE